MDIQIVQIIQAMLAPGIMISACGLLLLGMNNKYSLVVNRIRLLDDEKRRLKGNIRNNEMTSFDEPRLRNINSQLLLFEYRVKLVRNAVLSYSIAVALFIGSCLAIGMNSFSSFTFAAIPALILFLLGMLSVFIGVIFAAMEMRKGYEIIEIEIRQEV
jgi:hypothetical protein